MSSESTTTTVIIALSVVARLNDKVMREEAQPGLCVTCNENYVAIMLGDFNLWDDEDNNCLPDSGHTVDNVQEHVVHELKVLQSMISSMVKHT